MTTLPKDLSQAVEDAGYYPALVLDVLEAGIAAEPIVDYLVHVETSFVMTTVHRHVTVLVLTGTRLVMAHVDDRPADETNPVSSAAATTQTIPISQLRSVALTYGVATPEGHEPGELPSEVTLGLCWGAVQRIDIEHATCGDPECEGDHGLTGTIMPDDVMVRVSAHAEGDAALRSAIRFAKALLAATAAR